MTDNYYKIKAISHSSLGWFEHSPKYFKKMYDREIEEKATPYFDFGHAFHCALLEPTAYKDNYVVFKGVVPTHDHHKSFCKCMIGEGKSKQEAYCAIYKTKGKSEDKIKAEAEELYNSYKEYIEFSKGNAGKTFVDHSVSADVNLMISSLSQHKLSNELYFSDIDLMMQCPDAEIFMELIIEFVWPGMDIKCKSKIDKLIVNHNTKTIRVIDAKSMGKEISKANRSILTYQYDRQMAFYTVAVMEFLNQKGIDYSGWDIEWYISLTENFGLYETRVFELSDSRIESKIHEISDMIKAIKEHFSEDVWDYPLSYYSGSGAEQLILNDETEND